jgi:hypothetical protein
MPPDFVCPSCAHANPDGSRFCNRCGVPVSFRACDACDAVNETAATSCHKCGARFATITPTRAVTAATATSTGVAVAIAGLVGLCALLFFAYQEDPEAAGAASALLPLEMVTFVEPETVAVDAAGEDRLRATMLTVPVAAAKPAKASAKPRKPPSPKPKPRAVR